MTSRDVITLDLARIMERWDPADHPRHCSNCLHAKVAGTAPAPTVVCARGHGQPRSFWQLCRTHRPSGFASARTCPDFTSMDDDAV